jgi:hypothetical protein
MVTCMDDSKARLIRESWDRWAADLSAELDVPILWCPLGFEVPTPGGGITHVPSADAVRTILGGTRE